AQTKAEHAQAHADRKAKLKDRLNRLDSKLQDRLQKSKERREAAKRAAQAKVQDLKAKAAGAQARVPREEMTTMAATTTTTSAPPGLLDDIKRRSGWGLFMGILTMALGVVLIIYPFATATITTVFLGSMLLIVGVAELVLGFYSRSPRGFFARVFLAILFAFSRA